MKLYIVQVETDGIPDTPGIFTDYTEAETAYTDAWRELHEHSLRGEDNIAAELDKIMAGDFDSDWFDDGGVRMWTEDVPGVERINKEANA